MLMKEIPNDIGCVDILGSQAAFTAIFSIRIGRPSVAHATHNVIDKIS